MDHGIIWQTQKEVVKEDFMVEKERRKDYGRRNKERNRTSWKEKRLQTLFADSVSWQWLRSGYIKRNKKAIITAAQDQALGTNWIKANIDGVDCSLLCGVCQSVDESSMHIVVDANN